MSIYNTEEIDLLRESGKRLAAVLSQVSGRVQPGVSTGELNVLGERLITEQGDTPAFKGYQPDGASYPFPAGVCISVNDEIVHGIPSDERVLQDGDIVGLDCGVNHKGLITDSAVTIAVGEVDSNTKALMQATKEALAAGVAAAKDGARVGDVSAAIEQVARKNGFVVVEELGGHGVGHVVHEEPFIPNYGKAGTGPYLKEGQVIALEPIFTAGNRDIVLAKDGYTFKTQDGSKSAHFEHTVLVTKDGGHVLTQ